MQQSKSRLFPTKPQTEGRKKQVIKKYQYTKPYKQRNRANDIGMDLPGRKKRKLKFPPNPLYYIVTKQKQKPGDPLFNLFNKDHGAIEKAIETVQRSRSKKSEESQVQSASFGPHSSSINLRSSLFDSEKASKKKSKYLQRQSSQGENTNFKFKTPTDQSLNSDPFNKGYSVTSGPKKYQSDSGSLFNGSLKLGTPVESLISGQNSEYEAKSHNHKNGNSEQPMSISLRPSV